MSKRLGYTFRVNFPGWIRGTETFYVNDNECTLTLEGLFEIVCHPNGVLDIRSLLTDPMAASIIGQMAIDRNTLPKAAEGAAPTSAVDEAARRLVEALRQEVSGG